MDNNKPTLPPTPSSTIQGNIIEKSEKVMEGWLDRGFEEGVGKTANENPKPDRDKKEQRVAFIDIE